MPAKLIDGKAVAASVRAALAPRIKALAARGVKPGLAAVLAGADPASRIYVRNKVRACGETGVRSEVHEFPEPVSENDLLRRIAVLNLDKSVHGILVQLPLPGYLDEERVLAAVAPAKDVDGFHAANLGALVQGSPGFVPGTPAGVIQLLEHAGVPIAGRHAVVVGRSTIVGKPMALLLLQKDATVTICHSKTPDLGAATRQADILVVAAGREKLIGAGMVKPGACVIDVGTNRNSEGKLVGDVDFAAASEAAGWITPVPGGVGPMTVAMLIANTVKAAERSLA
jgi:methylenetetrahydrofolate dehydrogenase (NADP+)/methenyltetrahydrofolate cyclohydrolase